MTVEVETHKKTPVLRWILMMAALYFPMVHMGGFPAATLCMAVILVVIGLILLLGEAMGDVRVPKKVPLVPAEPAPLADDSMNVSRAA